MSYILDTTPKISMPKKCENSFICELLENYTYGMKWDVLFNFNDNYITIGDYTKTKIDKHDDYVLNVTDSGVYIEGNDFPGVMHGFISFLERIRYSAENNNFYIECCHITDSPKIQFRCVHLCVFPETTLDFLTKCIRSCSVARYSHIILEFWGMLKFDCMKELSWPFAYNKEEIKKLIKEANALGVEIIPMFNHLGHASACREIHGKHVVLDQAPKYEYMFNSFGWVWNFKRADVRALLKNIRDELIDICGDGNYFHLGCDEAYSFGHNPDKALEMAQYLNEINEELKFKGRRGIIWHDMLLDETEYKDYIATSTKASAGILINNISKDFIIADWQYFKCDEMWKSSLHFKNKGFDVVCCPWHNSNNIDKAVETITKNGLYGLIHTTWDTLTRGFREMIYAGVNSYGAPPELLEDIHRFYCANVVRKVTPSFGKYEECGWSRNSTGPGL